MGHLFSLNTLFLLRERIFLAHLNNLHGELLYYPRCWRWHWRRHWPRRPQMLKFLRPHYFLTLSPIWFIFGMMIHIGPKFCAVPSHLPRSCQSQGHRLWIFMLKFHIRFLARLFTKKTTRYCHSSGVVCVVVVVVQKLGYFVISQSLLKIFTWNSD